MPRKLGIRSASQPAVTIHRGAADNPCLAYIAVANRPIAYSYGRSHIVYIGTTRAGASRIAASAAAKAPEMLALHGITHLEFYVITCQPRRRVKTWRKLERALLLTFRQEFGEIPRCNSQGNRMVWTDEAHYFTEARLRSIIHRFS